MSNLQYLPGDPRLVDQLVYELKSKGIFDQFRKECIADVDTRPAYQNLRQRVESSVATFLSRQVWKPDLNKNQLREKLRKHLLDGNYLEQGVERIVDQVVNPKVASVFIPQVEDLVYNYLGIPRKKPAGPETSNGRAEDLLPTDLEAVSPGSVKSNDEKDMDTSDSKDEKMDIEDISKSDIKDDSMTFESLDKEKEETKLSGISELTIHDSDSVSTDKSTITIPLPAEIKLENIPAPENSPPNIEDIKIDLEKIDLPQEPNLSTDIPFIITAVRDIPLPDEIPKVETDTYFKPIALNSEDDDESSNSSIQRNMSPLTPIRNFNNENSCDAQQAFENDSDSKSDDKKEPSSFRFTIESKSAENSSDAIKPEKKEEPSSYQFNTPAVNAFNTPVYEDSSNSNNLQIDYESDANSKVPEPKAPEPDHNSVDSHKKEKKDDKRSSSHKSSHRSRDSHTHSSSKDKRSDSKHSSSRDSSRHDKKTSSSKDDKSKSSEKKSDKERSSDKNDKGDKKDSRESSKHRSSSHKDSKSSSHKDSKHKGSSSSKRSIKDKDEKDKKSSSTSSRDKEKERSSDKSKNNKNKSKDYTSSSRDKDKKSSSSSKRSDDKENKEKKEKKEADDHYSLSGRGNPNRRSTDRDSNDGSSSSKGSHNRSHSKSAGTKKETKTNSKSGSTSSSNSTSPSDGVEVMTAKNITQSKPVVRVDTCLENPISTPPRLPFVPDVTLKKPKFAANMQEARQLIKMRKFLEEEQKKMNQEAALLLEFQANVRPSLSQVYSSIPGPELEFACMPNGQPHSQVVILEEPIRNHVEKNVVDGATTEKDNVAAVKPEVDVKIEDKHDDEIAKTLIAMHEDGTIAKVESKEDTEEGKVEHTDASVLEDLTDQEDESKVTVENIEMPEEEVVIVIESIDNDVELENMENVQENSEAIKTELKSSQYNTYIETTVTIEDLQETENNRSQEEDFKHPEENPLYYFTQLEQYESELERDKFGKFLRKYTNLTSKMFLVNCDTYEENLIKEIAQDFGKIEIVNYFKNGHLKLPKATKNIVKHVNVATEIILPTKQVERPETPIVSRNSSPILSPTKSECSFELSSDYDAKLEEMVNRTSRKEIMEIILGGGIDDCPSEMPRIDYCMESNIEHNYLKRKYSEVETIVNNNEPVLKPKKLRKISCSDLISSTTEELEETANNNRVQNTTRSKYLGKARRVGLPKPKKSNIQNSPSSDKSVENYQQNETPNGKIKNTPRSKVQRYDTSDLYKPKLHYLSRRNNIS